MRTKSYRFIVEDFLDSKLMNSFCIALSIILGVLVLKGIIWHDFDWIEVIFLTLYTIFFWQIFLKAKKEGTTETKAIHNAIKTLHIQHIIEMVILAITVIGILLFLLFQKTSMDIILNLELESTIKEDVIYILENILKLPIIINYMIMPIIEIVTMIIFFEKAKAFIIGMAETIEKDEDCYTTKAKLAGIWFIIMGGVKTLKILLGFNYLHGFILLVIEILPALLFIYLGLIILRFKYISGLDAQTADDML